MTTEDFYRLPDEIKKQLVWQAIENNLPPVRYNIPCAGCNGRLFMLLSVVNGYSPAGLVTVCVRCGRRLVYTVTEIRDAP